MISQDRANELVEIYNGLKKRITAIDDKYSLDFHEPQLDLPESLGLEKLTFTPKTEAEITALAKEKTDAAYLSRYSAIVAWRANYQKDFAAQKSKITADKNAAANKEYYSYKAIYDDTYAKLARNGLLFSSLRETKLAEVVAEHERNVSAIEKDAETARAIIDAKENACNNSYSNKITTYNKQYAAQQSVNEKKIREDQSKERQRIEKYNQSVDEKENRYQLALEKFREAARKNEYDRVYKMTKLYSELGETGIKNRKLAEKLAVSKEEFSPLTKEEAQFILSIDSFLRAHLDSNYGVFVSWVSGTLK